jgi:hypothetical protein
LFKQQMVVVVKKNQRRGKSLIHSVEGHLNHTFIPSIKINQLKFAVSLSNIYNSLIFFDYFIHGKRLGFCNDANLVKFLEFSNFKSDSFSFSFSIFVSLTFLITYFNLIDNRLQMIFSHLSTPCWYIIFKKRRVSPTFLFSPLKKYM